MRHRRIRCFAYAWFVAFAFLAPATAQDRAWGETLSIQKKEAQDSKLDSRLRDLGKKAAVRVVKPEALANAVNRASGGSLRMNQTGEIQVYVFLRQGFSYEIAQPTLVQLGFRTELMDERNAVIQGWLPASQLDILASAPFVRKITPPDYAIPRTGSINSEGDAILGAPSLRSLGIDGQGVKVGVISDGVNTRAQAIASGDLPPVITIVRPGDGDEGTAMLEIVHDLAPAATLLFCGPGTSIEMSDCVTQLRSPAFGADVIVDDLGFFFEPYFEDGVGTIAATVKSVVASGALYISAAGNEAQQFYEANFFPSATTPPPDYQALHDFGLAVAQSTDAAQSYLLAPGESAFVILQWNEPFGQAANDYDLFALIGNQVVGASTDFQNGNDDPIEAVSFENTSGATVQVDVFVALFSGSPKRLKLQSSPGAFQQYFTAPGSIFGHPAVTGAVAVGAVGVTTPDTIQAYSSQGPVRIDFPALVLRPKPDVVATDCGHVTGAGGFGQDDGAPAGNIFCGTSAAAPHVAGVMALLKSRFQGDVAQALRNSAIDLGAPGFDGVYGAGRVSTSAAAALLNRAPTAVIDQPVGNPNINTGQSVNFQGSCSDPESLTPSAFNWNFGVGSGIPDATVEDPGSVTFNNGDQTFTVSFRCTDNFGVQSAPVTRVVSVGNVGADIVPDPFILADISDVPISTQQTSDSVTIANISQPAPISVSGGEYSIGCGSSFTNTTGMISNNQSVCVRHTSSANHQTIVDTLLTVGPISDTFTSTTAVLDSVPDSFTFAPQTDVIPNTLLVSETITVSGINGPADIVISGGEYSIGCGSNFTLAVDTIDNGETVCVRHLSASAGNTATNTVLSIDGVSGVFSSTTRAVSSGGGGGGDDDDNESPGSAFRGESSGGGGCAVAAKGPDFDPLWLLALVAAATRICSRRTNSTRSAA